MVIMQNYIKLNSGNYYKRSVIYHGLVINNRSFIGWKNPIKNCKSDWCLLKFWIDLTMSTNLKIMNDHLYLRTIFML